MRRRILRAAAVGSLAAASAVAAPPAGAVRPASAVEAVPDAMHSKDPLGALLSDGRAACGRFRDYRCTFTRQERVNGALTAEQVAVMNVRAQPFSVALRFARPDAVAGQEMVYVERKRPDGKMKFRPAGAAGVAGFQLVAADDRRVPALGRRPVSKLGVAAVLDTLSLAAARERSLGNAVEVFASDYAFAGRPVTRYEVVTARPHVLREFYRAVVYVDNETRLPVRYEAYDQPRPGGPAGGELLEAAQLQRLQGERGAGRQRVRVLAVSRGTPGGEEPHPRPLPETGRGVDVLRGLRFPAPLRGGRGVGFFACSLLRQTHFPEMPRPLRRTIP